MTCIPAKRIMPIYTWALFMIWLGGCTPVVHSNLLGTTWIQTSAEYRANSIQTYKTAMRNIQAAVDNSDWTAALEQNEAYHELPPAVIFDIDETVLDNSPYQAGLILTNSKYSEDSWDSWIHKKQAQAIPGAIEFITALYENGITSIFITNRTCKHRKNLTGTCPQKNDTLKNLRTAGIIQVAQNNTLLKNEKSEWGSEKRSRRKYVAEHYRILMIVGDDLGDFIPYVKNNITYKERNKLVEKYREKWGKQWFILANPLYGSWERVLNKPKSRYLRLR